MSWTLFRDCHSSLTQKNCKSSIFNRRAFWASPDAMSSFLLLLRLATHSLGRSLAHGHFSLSSLFSCYSCKENVATHSTILISRSPLVAASTCPCPCRTPPPLQHRVLRRLRDRPHFVSHLIWSHPPLSPWLRTRKRTIYRRRVIVVSAVGAGLVLRCFLLAMFGLYVAPLHASTSPTPPSPPCRLHPLRGGPSGDGLVTSIVEGNRILGEMVARGMGVRGLGLSRTRHQTPGRGGERSCLAASGARHHMYWDQY